MTAIFVHGVGSAESGFSVEARRNLRECLRRRKRAFWGLECLWSGVTGGYQSTFLRRAHDLGSDGNITQRLAVEDGADATMYAYSAVIRMRIWACIAEQFAKCHRPPVVFAHSLGCLAVIDYLRAYPSARISALYTMGFNMGGMFAVDGSFVCPPQLAQPGVWANLWDPSDGLGWPAHALDGFDQVADLKVSVSHWADRWTGVSHTRYWNNERLWLKTIPKLLE